MIYPKNFEAKIGFDIVRSQIASHCISAMGKNRCESMQYSTRLDHVEQQLAQVHEFMAIISAGKEFPLNYYFDLRGPLNSIRKPGSLITVEHLFNLQRSLFTIAELCKFFASSPDSVTPYPALQNALAALSPFPEITAHTLRILDKFGNIADSASPQLKELRRSLASTQGNISNIMRGVISRARQDGFLDADVTPSVRDGRLVLPVPPMHKRKIRGIVHDESATGRTVFIEPEEIVEANNRIREIEAEIQREIARILTDTADVIRPHIPELLEAYELLGLIDFIRAKALFAIDVDAQMPKLDKKPQIELYHAIHPALLLTLRAQGKEVVPLNVALNKRDRILLISGPNAGGKSVCLKTIAIVQYMTQCGVMPTVHDNSHLSIFNNLMIDIGDQQSIEDDLSTYSSHLFNMKTFINRADQRTLVLIDEFGGGTEPQIGGALAQGVLEQLNKRTCFGVITTHYQNLKTYADQTPGIINGAMLYDRQQMKPLFQLSVGYPGSSFAIEIARKIGLPEEVISYAESIVGSDYVNMDKYLLDIARDKKYWENKRREIHQKEKTLDAMAVQYNEQIDNINREQKEIIRSAKHEAKEILAQTNANIERTILEIRKAQAEKQRTKDLRRELDEFRRRIDEENANEGGTQAVKSKKLKTLKGQKQQKPAEPQNTTDATSPLKEGDNVTIGDGNSVGTIIKIEGKKAQVSMGDFKTTVALSNLKRTMKQPAQRHDRPTLSVTTTDAIRSRQLNFNPEIDLRGMRADEAVQAVTYFLDDAIQFSIGRLRILHGTGTGALRQYIRQYLNTVPQVKSYHDEHVQFGGAGITVVDLE